MNLTPTSKPPGGMEHWVYDNRVNRYARVHRADCTFCDQGQGLHRRGLNAAAGQWLGPFPSLADAQTAADATGRTVSRCSVCAPAPRGSVGGTSGADGVRAEAPLQLWTPDLADVEVVQRGDAVEVVDRALGTWVVRFEPFSSSLPTLGGERQAALAVAAGVATAAAWSEKRPGHRGCRRGLHACA